MGPVVLGEEDCLYLDVYAPEGTIRCALELFLVPRGEHMLVCSGDDLEVMVWIFGGGYVIGDSWEFGLYDGKNFARNHDVVIVRVGARRESPLNAH